MLYVCVCVCVWVCVCLCVCAPSGRKEQRFWDGQKAVYVVLRGSTVVLPCINRRSVWTDGGSEEEQQVGEAPGVPPRGRDGGGLIGQPDCFPHLLIKYI